MELIYRGTTYNYNPDKTPGRPFKQVREAGPAYNLNYRGVTYRVDPNAKQSEFSVRPAAYELIYRGSSSQTELHIHLQPELVGQVAEASEVDTERLDLVNCFCKQDLNLQHIAMLLLAQLRSGGMMSQLYVESLTQVLVIHLLQHYSKSTQIITSENRTLTRTQLQQAIDYIHTHLDRGLSLVELAKIINISSTYFASLFKRAMGISSHQYVIQQRVERANLLLTTTDLTIADIALQVGFSSQSHLTQKFKRFTGMTPQQVRPLP